MVTRPVLGAPSAAEVDRCHEATAFDHCCRVCAGPGEPYYEPVLAARDLVAGHVLVHVASGGAVRQIIEVDNGQLEVVMAGADPVRLAPDDQVRIRTTTAAADAAIASKNHRH
jgi:hypothetical protein